MTFGTSKYLPSVAGAAGKGGFAAYRSVRNVLSEDVGFGAHVQEGFDAGSIEFGPIFPRTGSCAGGRA